MKLIDGEYREAFHFGPPLREPSDFVAPAHSVGRGQVGEYYLS